MSMGLLALPAFPQCPMWDAMQSAGLTVHCASGYSCPDGFAVVERDGTRGVVAWSARTLSSVAWARSLGHLLRLAETAQMAAPPARDEPSIVDDLRARLRRYS